MAKKGQKAKRARGPKIFRNEPQPPVITPTHEIHEYAKRYFKGDTWLTKTLAEVAKGGQFDPNTGKVKTKEQLKKIEDRAKRKDEAAEKKSREKRVKANKAVEARRIREDTIAKIQEIQPNFSDPDKVLSQSQLDKRLADWQLRKPFLDTIKSGSQELYEQYLTSGRMPDIRKLEADADYYLRGGAGDPNADISQRKGPKGILETELPPQLNQAEIDSTVGIAGSKVRPTIEIDRTGSDPQFHAKQWNGLVEQAADKLEANGQIEPGYSNVRRPKNYKGDGSGSRFLTNKELWKAKRLLEYGHLGSASQPGFFYVVNYDGNGHPEFALWNRQTDAGMTPTEYDIAGKRIGSGRGFEWDRVNRARFDGYLDEMLGILDNEGFDALSQTLGYFEDLDESPWHLDDPQRDYISKTTIQDRPNLDPDSSYLLTNDHNNFTLDNFTRDQNLEVRKAAIRARIGFMKSIPQVDLKAALGGAKGLITARGEQALDLKVSEEAKVVETLTDEDLAILRKYGLEVMAEGENLTVDQVFRRAISRMPKTPAALAAALGNITKAFADAPADEETLMTVLRGLEMYDQMGPGTGRDLWMKGLEKVGLDGAVKYMDDSIESGITGLTESVSAEGYAGADAAVLRFLKQLGVDTVTETPGVIWDAAKKVYGWIDPNSPTNLGTQLEGVLTGPPSTLEDQWLSSSNSAPPQEQFFDFQANQPIPQNVMELYPEATPWKKYGGVLQRQW